MIELLVAVVAGVFSVVVALISSKKDGAAGSAEPTPAGGNDAAGVAPAPKTAAMQFRALPTLRAGIMGIFAFGAVLGLSVALAISGPLPIPTVTPTGTIVAYWGPVAPSGWLLCDGSKIPEERKELIAMVGANTPDLQGYFLRGLDPSGKVDTEKDRKIGSAQPDQVGPHTHDYNFSTRGGKSGGSPPDTAVLGGTAQTGSGVGKETRPKNKAVNFIIKY